VSVCPRSEPSTEVQQWIEFARSGSRTALEQLLEDSRDYLLLVADGELRSDLQARIGAWDLVQETFARACDQFAEFRGTSDQELRAWLRDILVNQLAKLTRDYRATGKRRRTRAVNLADTPFVERRQSIVSADRSPRAELAVRESVSELEQLLARLPEEDRQAICWRNGDGLSFEEIGRRLGRSAGAARKLWARAIEHIQSLREPGDATA
jgi:RNA polymerase sigma-70 factor (ECF subfamily)